jgi:hypothetical protein
MLGVSLRLRLKATSSKPCKSNSDPSMQMHNAREAPLCFAGNHWHYRHVVGNLRKTSKEKSFGRVKAEDACRRWRTGYYLKATTSPQTRVSVLLEAL